ncbi:hypothetical protein LguiA_009596 [Lonicera macranthoides]
MNVEYGTLNQMPLQFPLCCNGADQKYCLKERNNVRRCSSKREEKSHNSNNKNKNTNRHRHRHSSKVLLSHETISEYFYMPITQAAKELNVGLTLLKKRCRELGIRRWPHRKLVSLQTLINNVQELGKEGGEGHEEKMRGAIEILEKQRRLMEKVPDMRLEDKTKRLRQACFKANYKKRKIMKMMMLPAPNSHSSAFSTSCGYNSNGSVEFDCEARDGDFEEEMKSLLGFSFSSTNISF